MGIIEYSDEEQTDTIHLDDILNDYSLIEPLRAACKIVRTLEDLRIGQKCYDINENRLLTQTENTETCEICGINTGSAQSIVGAGGSWACEQDIQLRARIQCI